MLLNSDETMLQDPVLHEPAVHPIKCQCAQPAIAPVTDPITSALYLDNNIVIILLQSCERLSAPLGTFA